MQALLQALCRHFAGTVEAVYGHRQTEWDRSGETGVQRGVLGVGSGGLSPGGNNLLQAPQTTLQQAARTMLELP